MGSNDYYKLPDNLKVGDYIKDIEDGDFWYEGIITYIKDEYLFYYRLEKVYFMDDGYVEDERIGTIIPRNWYWLEVLLDETRDKKINELLK